MKAHPLLIGSLVAVPLAVGFAVFANVVDLGVLATLVLLGLVLLIPTALALELAARRAGHPTRLSRTADSGHFLSRRAG